MSRAALREPGVEERERRTIIVERSAGSFGFTLQSYGIHYRDENDVEVITYVDYVDPLGQAHRAGLRSGDVILSINGQDVERADHSTLVSIIQTCPNRIRMVVLFENCVRKVELHMKYIRLQQILEQKAREYQEVCAREKTLVSRMNRGRGGSGTYQTMQLSSQNKDNANSLSCVGSSKSMPRSCSHSSSSCRCDASMGRRGRAIEGSVKERCLKKTNSYLCINRNGGADCEGCFHQLEDAAKKGVKFKSKSGEAHRSNAQRPRSFHISSCYKDPAYHHQLENDHYLKSQSDWTAVKTYGGHGGFDYDSSLVSAHNSSSYNSFPRHHVGDAVGRVSDHQVGAPLVDPSYYRRSLLPKSADDLLAAQFQNQCQMSPLQQNTQVRRPSNGRGMAQQQSLDSISFYTRPPQPKPVIDMEHSATRPEHFQPPQHQLRLSLKQAQQRQQQQQQQQQQQLSSRLPGKSLRGNQNPDPRFYDEGGFDEVRSFRTLPMVNRRATEYN